MKAAFWKLLFGRWPRSANGPERPGYSVLLPVPADLPFLTTLGLEVCARQNPEHRNEILVIPDNKVDEAFGSNLLLARRAQPQLPVRLVTLGPVARAITRRGNGHLNHFLQIIHGVSAARSEHVLLHDADAFLYDTEFLLRLYERCRTGYHAYGVHPVWDDWYRDNGYAHVVATWELMMERSWAKSFRPYEHRGRSARIGAVRHVFDTMLLPQCRTPAEKIGRLDAPSGFVHFNYVICTYRSFLRASDGMEDDRFRLLLIRLLNDALAEPGVPDICRVPEYPALCKGLEDRSAMVRYVEPSTAANYAEFRERIGELLAERLLPEAGAARMRERLEPFDRRFGCAPRPERALASG